jgi:hypothetical protein
LNPINASWGNLLNLNPINASWGNLRCARNFDRFLISDAQAPQVAACLWHGARSIVPSRLTGEGVRPAPLDETQPPRGGEVVHGVEAAHRVGEALHGAGDAGRRLFWCMACRCARRGVRECIHMRLGCCALTGGRRRRWRRAIAEAICGT